MHRIFEQFPKCNTIFFLGCDPNKEEYELVLPYDDSDINSFEVLYFTNINSKINSISSPRKYNPKLTEKEIEEEYLKSRMGVVGKLLSNINQIVLRREV